LIAVCAALVITNVALPQKSSLPPAQAALVAAERAFAKLGAERGVRESFLTWFADDAIAFYPQPMRAKDKLSKDPVETLPLPYTLHWAPVYGDIAQAGDLGYNLGPIRVDDHSPAKKPPQHAVFFSVWKKQPDGAWRVALDLGVGVPAPVAALDAPFQAAPRVAGKHSSAPINVEKERLGLLELEKAFLAESAAGLPQAMQKRADDAIRVHRPGQMPVSGKQALQGWLAEAPQAGTIMTGQPLFADVSRSGDLAYSYGNCELGGTLTRKGHFARVWRRDAQGHWRIAVDVLNLLPPPPAKPTG
jgi:ketosteroid isomerase-like protein